MATERQPLIHHRTIPLPNMATIAIANDLIRSAKPRGTRTPFIRCNLMVPRVPRMGQFSFPCHLRHIEQTLNIILDKL